MWNIDPYDKFIRIRLNMIPFGGKQLRLANGYNRIVYLKGESPKLNLTCWSVDTEQAGYHSWLKSKPSATELTSFVMSRLKNKILENIYVKMKRNFSQTYLLDYNIISWIKICRKEETSYDYSIIITFGFSFQIKTFMNDKN